MINEQSYIRFCEAIRMLRRSQKNRVGCELHALVSWGDRVMQRIEYARAMGHSSHFHLDSDMAMAYVSIARKMNMQLHSGQRFWELELEAIDAIEQFAHSHFSGEMVDALRDLQSRIQTGQLLMAADTGVRPMA